MIPAREPRYFGSTDRPIFGWLHRAPAPAHVGLVICAPFGYEAVCAHRSLRHLAQTAAAAGVPSLRFDYDGTGDSCGDLLEPVRVTAWIESIHAAVAELKRATGVHQVVLAGLRLGATLAATAAETRTDVAGLVAIAPVIAGRGHLRELKALQMAAGLGDPPEGRAVPAGVVQEALGFPITSEMQVQLQALDLMKAPRPPARQLLVIERDDMPGADKWLARLREQGAEVTHARLPGYVEMMLDPHKTTVPERIIDAVEVWLEARAAAEPAASHTHVPAIQTARLGDVTEQPVYLDADHGQFGILTEPVTRPGRRKGILLLNAGAVPHIGPNRLYVVLARKLAAAGHAVLRMDIAGIGDSRPRAGHPENVVYTRDAKDDVAGGLAALGRLPGVTELHIAGLCSGAYNAVKAAAGGLRVRGIVPINPLTFTWHDPMPLDYPAFKVAGEAKRYQEAAFSAAKWKKLLRGEVNVRAVGQVMARRAWSLAQHRARDLARTIRLPFPDDVGAELEAIARREIAMDFVFASGDPGVELLRMQGGSAVPKLRARGALRSHMIEGPDHTFTPVWSHAPLIDTLLAILAGPVR